MNVIKTANVDGRIGEICVHKLYYGTIELLLGKNRDGLYSFAWDIRFQKHIVFHRSSCG